MTSITANKFRFAELKSAENANLADLEIRAQWRSGVAGARAAQRDVARASQLHRSAGRDLDPTAFPDVPALAQLRHCRFIQLLLAFNSSTFISLTSYQFRENVGASRQVCFSCKHNGLQFSLKVLLFFLTLCLCLIHGVNI